MMALSDAGLKQLSNGLDQLPASSEEFDEAHREWRVGIIKAIGRNLSHGRSAKLINVYLKALFLSDFGSSTIVNGGSTPVDFIHPPIDRLLLLGLAKNAPRCRDEWRKLRDANWTEFDQQKYENVIELVRETTGGKLWKIEEYWPVTGR